jgi:hypothetical protein
MRLSVFVVFARLCVPLVVDYRAVSLTRRACTLQVEEEALYDELDETAYKKLVQERRKARDFVEDDGELRCL